MHLSDLQVRGRVAVVTGNSRRIAPLEEMSEDLWTELWT